MSAGAHGFLNRLIDRDESFDRRALFKLASWGGVGLAMLLGVLILAQSPLADRRYQQPQLVDQLQRQTLALQQALRDAQAESRRLSSAIDVLNADRDRLYARVTSVEQDVVSVTGSIAKHQVAPPAPSPLFAAAAVPVHLPSPPPSVAATESAPSPKSDTEKADAAKQEPPKLDTAKSEASKADSTKADSTKADSSKADISKADASRPDVSKPDLTKPEIAALEPARAQQSAPEVTGALSAAARAEFGLDLGGAGSIEGLRVLWAGLRKSHGAALEGLRPLIVIKERRGSGGGMQLRLVAGPVSDATQAAKLCAGFTGTDRECEPAVFDGQRLSLRDERPARTTSRRSEAAPAALASPPSFFPFR